MCHLSASSPLSVWASSSSSSFLYHFHSHSLRGGRGRLIFLAVYWVAQAWDKHGCSCFPNALWVFSASAPLFFTSSSFLPFYLLLPSSFLSHSHLLHFLPRPTSCLLWLHCLFCKGAQQCGSFPCLPVILPSTVLTAAALSRAAASTVLFCLHVLRFATCPTPVPRQRGYTTVTFSTTSPSTAVLTTATTASTDDMNA